jgi:hypothetical protein
MCVRFPAVTANLISGAAFVVSAIALVVSWMLGVRSAKAAESSAEDARQVRKAEHEREHRDYAPKLEGMKFVWETNSRGGACQFLTFRLPRTYRVFGDLISDTGSRTPVGGAGGNVFEAGVPQHLSIGDDVGKQPEAVELRFFPPVAGDPGETWSCPCDRDAVPDRHDKAGHWVLREPVPLRVVPMVTWGG